MKNNYKYGPNPNLITGSKMDAGKIIENGFKICKENPKAMLPVVLKWIPTVIFSYIGLQIVSEVRRFMTGQNIMQIFSDPKLILSIISYLISYTLIFIPVIVLSVLISAFIKCVHMDIGRQYSVNKKVNLFHAFINAKNRFLPLILTHIIVFLIGFAVFSMVMLTSIFLTVVIPVLGAIMMVLIMFIGLLALIPLGVFLYQIPPVVVIEGVSYLDAIKRSFQIGKKVFWKIILIVLVGSIVSGIGYSIVNQIPTINFALKLLAELFFVSWISLMQALVYFGSRGGKAEV